MEITRLVKRAKRKDADAFTELMESQMQNMYKVARSILSSYSKKTPTSKVGDELRLLPT